MTPQEHRETPNHSAPPMGTASRQATQPTLRMAMMRGLLAAGACVIVVAALAATWGGLFGFHPSATIYGTAPSGWEGAATMAVFCLIFVAPPVALVGFLVAFGIAKKARNHRSHCLRID